MKFFKIFLLTVLALSFVIIKGSNLQGKRHFQSHGVSQFSRLNRRQATHPSYNPLPPTWTTGPHVLSNGRAFDKAVNPNNAASHIHTVHRYHGTPHVSYGVHSHGQAQRHSGHH